MLVTLLQDTLNNQQNLMTIISRILIQRYLGVTGKLFWGCLQKMNYSCLAGPGEIPEIVIKNHFSCNSNAEIVVVSIVTNVDGFQSKTIYDLHSLLSQNVLRFDFAS